MTDVAALLQQRPEPKRDRFGRYLIGGKPYTRATTWAGTVDERYSLEKWQQRQVALGLAARPDLLARVASSRPDDKDALTKLCEQAIEASKGSAGANLGTALHAFTERVDLGEDVTVPAPWDADLAAYRSTLDTAGIRIHADYVERVVVNHTLGVAGTLDRLVDLPGVGLVVADLKTGGFLSWQSIAVQLALYANAEELYDPASDTCAPMPFVDEHVALVIHLPAGKAECTLHVVDIDAGWEAAQVCGTVRRWRQRKDLAAPYVPPVKSAVEPDPADPRVRGWVVRRVEAMRGTPGALERLAGCWPEGVPTFKQSDAHTAAELRQIEKAVRDVEFAFGLPVVDMHDPQLRDDRAAMAERVKGLNPEVLAAVEKKAAGLGPIAAMDADQLAELGMIVAQAEADAIRQQGNAA